MGQHKIVLSIPMDAPEYKTEKSSEVAGCLPYPTRAPAMVDLTGQHDFFLLLES